MPKVLIKQSKVQEEVCDLKISKKVISNEKVTVEIIKKIRNHRKTFVFYVNKKQFMTLVTSFFRWRDFGTKERARFRRKES